MSSRKRFFITDVFAGRRYEGNQLATFLDAASVPDAEMQLIARETRFSETTFILSDRAVAGGYDVRIFTPASEIDFAGHPTLGTAFVIRHHILRTPVREVVLNLKVGQVPVSFVETGGREREWMRQVEPAFGDRVERGEAAAVLGLREEDIDPRWPVEEVSTGLPTLIVPLRSMDALRRIAVDRRLYGELVGRIRAKVVLAFSAGGYTEEQSFGVRVFPIALGIDEDPATGSGTGCLGAYLVKRRVLGGPSIDVATGQGYEIGRPSTLFIRAADAGGRIQVEVGGDVVPVAEGWWG